MANTDVAFVGSVPQLYTRYMGPMFFEPYAADLANRLNGMISGRFPLVWAHSQVVCDSPDKKHVENGALAGRLMTRPVGKK